MSALLQCWYLKRMLGRFLVNNSGKPKKSKTEWRILFVVLVFWIAVLVKFLLPDGRWQIMRQLQDEYGEAFTICDSHIQKTDSGIYTFYTVSPKENPDVVFIVISGWSKGRWDGLLPIWHFPHKSVRENYKTAAWAAFCQEHQINTMVTEEFVMAFGTPQESEHLDFDFIEGNPSFAMTSDSFSETAEEIYALYCDFWDTSPFSHLRTEPDNAYQTTYAIYVKFYHAGREIEREDSHVRIRCQFDLNETWSCDSIEEKLRETASQPWKYVE